MPRKNMVDIVDCNTKTDHRHPFAETRYVLRDAAMYGAIDVPEFIELHGNALARYRFKLRHGVDPESDYDQFLAQRADLLEAQLLKARHGIRSSLLHWFTTDWHGAVKSLATTIVDLQEQHIVGTYTASPKWMRLLVMPSCKHSIPTTPAICIRQRPSAEDTLVSVLEHLAALRAEVRATNRAPHHRGCHRPTRAENDIDAPAVVTTTPLKRRMRKTVAVDATFVSQNGKNRTKPHLNRHRLAPRQAPDGWYVGSNTCTESPRKYGWEIEYATVTRTPGDDVPSTINPV